MKNNETERELDAARDLVKKEIELGNTKVNEEMVKRLNLEPKYLEKLKENKNK
jgi:hypothetical protein